MGVRQYYIDWLRIILILSVFLYHIGMVFSEMHWHVKNDLHIENLKYLMSFLHVWRIPLLFLIAGVSSFYSLGSKTIKQYLRERFIRLVIPFFVGIAILVPVQIYIEKINQYDSLFSFYPHLFDGIYPTGNFTWAHLWFIFYLFVFALVISPSLNFIRSAKFKKIQEKLIDLTNKKLGTNLFLIPLLLSQIILYPYLPKASHYSYDLLFFVFGLCVFSNKRIILALMEQRKLYLFESLILSAIMLSPYFINYGMFSHQITYFSSVMLALSCSMTALGYARKYLNEDSKFRKYLSEAIYPFYLIHQPIIVITAYFVVQWDLPIGVKFVAITLGALTISTGLYWHFIRPLNLFRVIFGLKALSSVGPSYAEIVFRNIQASLNFIKIKNLNKRTLAKQKYSFKLTHLASVQKLIMELVY